MNLEVWLTFVTVSLALCLTPGPVIFLVVSNALTHGKRSALPAAAGAVLGDIFLISSSVMGIGLLLSISPHMFNFIKLVSATYLIYVGAKMCVMHNNYRKTARQAQPLTIFRDAFLVTALNPKGILFFISFLSLFVTKSQPIIPQMIILIISFIAVSLSSISFYALIFGYVRDYLSLPKVYSALNKISGCLLITFGIITVGTIII